MKENYSGIFNENLTEDELNDYYSDFVSDSIDDYSFMNNSGEYV